MLTQKVIEVLNSGFDKYRLHHHVDSIRFSLISSNNFAVVVSKGQAVAYSNNLPADFLLQAKEEYMFDMLMSAVSQLVHRVRREDEMISLENPGKTHPSVPLIYMDMAAQMYRELAMNANDRGDPAGHDAWLLAKDAIDNAIKIADRSRMVQTWSKQ